MQFHFSWLIWRAFSRRRLGQWRSLPWRESVCLEDNLLAGTKGNYTVNDRRPRIPTLPIGFIRYRMLPVGPGRVLEFHGRFVPSSSMRCLSRSRARSPLHSGEEHWILDPLSCRAGPVSGLALCCGFPRPERRMSGRLCSTYSVG